MVTHSTTYPPSQCHNAEIISPILPLPPVSVLTHSVSLRDSHTILSKGQILQHLWSKIGSKPLKTAVSTLPRPQVVLEVNLITVVVAPRCSCCMWVCVRVHVHFSDFSWSQVNVSLRIGQIVFVRLDVYFSLKIYLVHLHGTNKLNFRILITCEKMFMITK